VPKQYYTIRDFSGGINSKRDPRDLQENECASIKNMSIDALGKIKTAGKLYAHIEDQDGDTNLAEYIVERTAGLAGGGGYGLFYFESDHSRDGELVITDTKHPGTSNDLTIGTSNGNISFDNVYSNPDPPPSTGKGGTVS
tara:strand:- start:436 stop:855 length:420 start_codon:yes stop_codon:yes gene_type:complete